MIHQNLNSDVSIKATDKINEEDTNKNRKHFTTRHNMETVSNYTWVKHNNSQTEQTIEASNQQRKTSD